MPSRYDQYATHHTSRRTDGWDYTQPAAYFVTICMQDRMCLFGDVQRGRMTLNAMGHVVAEEWKRSEVIRDRAHLDAFVVMPNHLHGIVIFADPDVEAPTCPRGYRAVGTGPGDESADEMDDASDSEMADDGNASPGGADDPPDRGMPNDETASHRRATLAASDAEDNPELHRPSRSLGAFIAGFKSAATTRINDHRDTPREIASDISRDRPGAPVWQRNLPREIDHR